MFQAPEEVKQALLSRAFSFAELITLNLGDVYASGVDLVLYLTTAGHDVHHAGRRYTADHALVALDGISRKASTGQDKVDLVWTLADVDPTLHEAVVTRRYVGKPVSIERVLLNSLGGVIGGYALPVRTSWCIAHEVDGDQENPTLSLTIDSLLGDVHGSNAWFITEASHQARYPGDRIMRLAAALTAEGRPQYVVSPDGVIEAQSQSQAVPVIYGERLAKLLYIGRHTNRYPSAGGWSTVWYFVISAGDVEFADLDNVMWDGNRMTRTTSGTATYDFFFRPARDSAIALADDPNLASLKAHWSASQLAELGQMHGHGLSLLIIRHNTRSSDHRYPKPGDMEVPVKGVRVWDPRTSQTAYSRNPALQYLDYLTNPDYGAGSKGVSVAEASLIEAADHYDAIPGSETLPGIDAVHFDVQIDTAESLADNLDLWIEGARLLTSDYWGELVVRVEGVAPVALSLKAADCRGAPTLERQASTERANRITYTFDQMVADPADPDALIKVQAEATYPPAGDPIFDRWLAEDGGRLQEGSHRLKYVSEINQALYQAAVDARAQRHDDTLTVVAPPIAWLLEPGDVFQYDDPLLGLSGSLWRLREVSEVDEGIELEAKPYEASDYSPDLALVPPPIPPAVPDSDFVLGPVSGFTQTVTEQGRLLVKWSATTGDPAWYDVLVSGPAGWGEHQVRVYETQLLLSEVAPGDYLVTVTPANRRYQGPPVTYEFVLAPPEPPTAINASSTWFSLSAAAAPAGSLIELRYGVSSVFAQSTPGGEGYTITVSGLDEQRTYWLWARVIGAVGRSHWFGPTTITTASKEDFKGPPGEGTPGEPGRRGTVRLVAAVAGSTWSNAVAYNAILGALENSGVQPETPIPWDVVTLSNAAQSYSETRNYVSGVGSTSVWDPVGEVIDGNLIVKGTARGDILEAGTVIRGPQLQMIGSAYMRILGESEFGSRNQFIDWFGLRSLKADGTPNWADVTESNARWYIKADGSLYIKGTLNLGTNQTDVQTTSSSATASTETGDFSYEGKTLTVSWSYSLSSSFYYFSENPESGSETVSVDVILEREIDSGFWTQIDRFTDSYTRTWMWETIEEQGWSVRSTGQTGHSKTITYNGLPAQHNYRARIVSRSGTIRYQKITILCIEE